VPVEAAALFLLRSRPTSLTDGDADVAANFAPHFAPSPPS
jgi:hypothetical protein